MVDGAYRSSKTTPPWGTGKGLVPVVVALRDLEMQRVGLVSSCMRGRFLALLKPRMDWNEELLPKSPYVIDARETMRSRRVANMLRRRPVRTDDNFDSSVEEESVLSRVVNVVMQETRIVAAAMTKGVATKAVLEAQVVSVG